MINKFILLYTILMFVSVSLWGQIQVNTGELTGRAYLGGGIEAFDNYQKGDSEESYYLNKNWSLGSIDFFNGKEFELENVPVKFDVVNNNLEIKINQSIKVADLKLVNTLKIFDPSLANDVIFVNGSTLGNSRNSLFNEVLKGNNYSVYKKHYSVKLPADYNPQFDVGSKSEKIQIKEKYYVFTEHTKKLTEFGISTSELKKFFSNDTSISQFIKREKLKIKKEQDLIQVFTLINNKPL